MPNSGLKKFYTLRGTGDYEAGKQLVENYAVKVDQEIQAELLSHCKKMNLALYRGFVKPVFTLVKNESGNVLDVEISYDKNYVDQNLNYSKEYSVLLHCN